MRSTQCTAASLALAAIVLATPALAQMKAGQPPVTPAPVMGAKTYSFPLHAFNGSGEAGTATLQAKGNDTIVTISVTGEPAGTQTAHIHPSDCEGVDQKKVAFKLKDVVGGKSVTTVPIPLGKLFGYDAYSVDIHKNPDVFAACGDIHPRNNMKTSATPAPGK